MLQNLTKFCFDSCFPAAPKLHGLFKTPAVIVICLSQSALLEKQLVKALEFLEEKKEAHCPKLVLLVVGASVGGVENSSPNNEAFQLVSAHAKRLYKIDLRDVALSWDPQRPAESGQALRLLVDSLSAQYYNARAGKKKKEVRPTGKAQRLQEVWDGARKAVTAALFLEFGRSTNDALALYRQAFAHMEQLAKSVPVDYYENVASSALLVSQKIISLMVAGLGVEDFANVFRQHIRDALRLLRAVKTTQEAWTHEWSARFYLMVAESLCDKASPLPSSVEDGQAFHYFVQTAKSLIKARSILKDPSPKLLEGISQTITTVLTRAYTQVSTSSGTFKRSKMHIAVMLADEACRAGRYRDALDMCQRISNPKSGQMCRYKAESWWSLLGVVDAIAATSAYKLGENTVALNHALRCLSPSAQCPKASALRMAEIIFELRRLTEQHEWVMADALDEALVAIDVKMDRIEVELGDQVCGSVFLTSHLPIAISFDAFSIQASKSTVSVDVPSPLVLEPFHKVQYRFVCRAPKSTLGQVSVVSACLRLGCIMLFREFEPSSRPFFQAVQRVDSNKPSQQTPLAKKAISVRTSPVQMRELRLQTNQGVIDGAGLYMTHDELLSSLDGVRGKLSIRTADLGGNSVGVEGIPKLAHWLTNSAPQIGSLSLWNCDLGPQCGGHIGTILRFCPALRVLNLGMNRLGDGGIAAFARCLQIAPALEELTLWRVGMSKTGLIVLADNLLPPSRVRVLDIRSNELGDGCEGVIAGFLSKNTSVLHLYLSDNVGLSASALKDLAQSLTHTNFSVQTFHADDDDDAALVKPLADVGRRNKEVSDMLQSGSFSLPFKAVQRVPAILLQSTGSCKRITHLDLSHNKIVSLPKELSQLENLSHCNMSHNQISDLSSIEWVQLRSLTFLDISHNIVAHVPVELSGLARLNRMDASNNLLQSLVPDLFSKSSNLCITLRELNLSNNQLTMLPATLTNLRNLNELLLNNNKLSEIIGGLKKLLDDGTLQMCNVSNNNLGSLPPPLAEHKERILISGNPLNQFPAEVVARGTSAVWEYLEDMRVGQQVCPRMKLMFVGQGNVGKTTLLKALVRGKVDTKNTVIGLVTGKGVRKQTDGIEVEEWSPEENLVFSTWDFAGQEVYYNTHQFFLSQRSLYLVVFSLAAQLQETNVLMWLNSLQVRAPGVPVLLVGTHADKKSVDLEDVSEKLSAAIGKWSKLYKKEGRIVLVKPENSSLCFHPVSSIRKTGNGLQELRDMLVKVALAQPCLKEQIPKIYLGLLDVIKRKRQQHPDQPFVDWAAVKSWGVIPEERALRRACRLLHDWGDVVSFQDGSLSDLVILDPNWLTSFMTTIVGVNSGLSGQQPLMLQQPVVGAVPSLAALSGNTSAIISPSVLPALWKSYPPSLYNALCKLLERFEVWVKLTPSGDYLVPCLLQNQPARKKNSFHSAMRAQDRMIGRVYVIPFCPHGFFSHLLLRMWTFCKIAEYWNNGAVAVQGDGQAVALVEVKPHASEQNPFQSIVQILARGQQAMALSSFMTKLVFTLHSFVQDWYGGLSDHVATFLPCVECLKRKANNESQQQQQHMFAANDFIREFLGRQGDIAQRVTCPLCHAEMAVSDVVPEIVGIAEGNGYAKEVVEERSIGMGGFAEVLLGTWKGVQVAIKKLLLLRSAEEAEGFTLQTFIDFAMEADMMQRLDHPNVVKLYAAYSRPPALVLEYVPMGSLDHVLRGMGAGPLQWPLIFRMALDIARGMEYLHAHEPRILHRDLKSPNVLVQSLDMNSNGVLLKVADLGMSCFYMGADSSGKRIENPRWVAPETLETGAYTDKSDVYSFGIILNELVTREVPFKEVRFDFEIEKCIMAGQRPTMHPETLEKYAKIITECWSRDPSSRPTFGAVAMRLVLLQEITKQ